MTSSSSKISPIRPVQKKFLTCFYWKNSKCKFQSDECQFMHEDTGKVAFDPKQNSKRVLVPAKKSDQNDSEADDLISLCSAIDLESKTGVAGSLKGSSSGSEEATSIIQFCPKLSGATILHAISNGQSCNFVKDLFIAFPRSAVNEALASNLDSFACLLAAVSLNSPALVRLLVEYGANPDAADDNGMPILAHSIINRSIYGTDIVKTLLALGANPHVIPSQLWINKTGRDEPHGIKPGAAWCNAMYQEVLKCFINIPVKYYLRRAAINGAFGSGPIKNKLPASFVGQEWAIQLVKDYLNAYNICKGNIPLILAFAGPPGHGKETLARALGDFHELSHVSCKKNSSSKQSNAASSFKGGLDVFFIDGDNVDRAWLKALFKRAISNKHQVECSTNEMKPRKAVHILSVTLSHDSMRRFYDNPGSPDEITMNEGFCSLLRNEIEVKLRREIIQMYGPSIAGCIQHIIPFMPFSTDERLALAHNFLMQALQNLAHSFLCRDPSAAKHGHEIRFRADNQVYEYLGSRKHCYQLGARSFERIVTTEAVLPIVSKYLDKVSGNAKNFRGHITLVVNQSKSGLEANVD